MYSTITQPWTDFSKLHTELGGGGKAPVGETKTFSAAASASWPVVSNSQRRSISFPSMVLISRMQIRTKDQDISCNSFKIVLVVKLHY